MLDTYFTFSKSFVPYVYFFQCDNKTVQDLTKKIFQKSFCHKNECDRESAPNGLQTILYVFLLSDLPQSLLFSLFFLQAMSWPGKSFK